MRGTTATIEMRKVGMKFFTEAVFREGGKLYKPSALLSEERSFRVQRIETEYDVFLVHQTKDRSLVANFKKFLADRGFKVYVDWLQDSENGRCESMMITKMAMNNSRTLICMHNHLSLPSRWTAWEIGYFDAVKDSNAITILPFLNHSGILPHYGGMEFLRNYTQIGVEYLETFVRSGQI